MFGRFVKLHEKITEWEWYKDGNTMRVFLHLLIKANWKPARYKGHDVEIGQVVTGYKALSKDLGISERAIRTSFEHLKTTGELTTKVTSKFSIVTLCNYSKYNGEKTSDDKQLDRQVDSQLTGNRQASDKQVTPLLEVKKKQTDKKEKKSLNPEACRLTGLLIEAIRKWKPDALVPTSTASWESDMDRMLRLDNRKPETIEAVLKWLPTDSFWPANILSASKLRKQFDKLEDQMKPVKQTQQPEHIPAYISRPHPSTLKQEQKQ